MNDQPNIFLEEQFYCSNILEELVQTRNMAIFGQLRNTNPEIFKKLIANDFQPPSKITSPHEKPTGDASDVVPTHLAWSQLPAQTEESNSKAIKFPCYFNTICFTIQERAEIRNQEDLKDSTYLARCAAPENLRIPQVNDIPAPLENNQNSLTQKNAYA
jgi:hypothetical protein